MITTSGDVIGENGVGVSALIDGGDYTRSDADLAVTVGGRVGGGISASNGGRGQGSIRIKAGEVDGGVGASLTGRGEGSVTIDAGAVTGEYGAIYAYSNATGDVTITTTGDVRATDFGDGYDYGAAITARLVSEFGDGDLTIASTSVMSEGRGIRANNDGRGDLSITVTGDVEGGGGIGISARLGSYESFRAEDASGSLAVVVGGDVTGGGYRRAVDVQSQNTGALSVSVGGAVRGGVYAEQRNRDATGDLTIAVGSAFAERNAVVARGDGAGDPTITVAGDVESARSGGVDATLGRNPFDYSGDAPPRPTGDVAVTVDGTVEAYGTGLYARNFGPGALSITAKGDVDVLSGSGIVASQVGGGDGPLSIRANGRVLGGARGIPSKARGPARSRSWPTGTSRRGRASATTATASASSSSAPPPTRQATRRSAPPP